MGCDQPPVWLLVRCSARYLSNRELEKRGLKPAEDIQILEREPPGKVPVNPLTGATPRRWIQRGGLPFHPKPTQASATFLGRCRRWAARSDGAERLLVDRLMAKACPTSGTG